MPHLPPARGPHHQPGRAQSSSWLLLQAGSSEADTEKVLGVQGVNERLTPIRRREKSQKLGKGGQPGAQLHPPLPQAQEGCERAAGADPGWGPGLTPRVCPPAPCSSQRASVKGDWAAHFSLSQCFKVMFGIT